ncbi:MAG: superoxide dismutase [Myxococcales bacterium]|nr:superoxide dismutase [Myxococcales bacterium]MCB9641465.1 superoxide dismutase [Myxococcales bacterium]
MKRWSLMVFLMAGLWMVGARQAEAHCQVPCGIYDDHARVHAMYEDTMTITKAIKNIKALSAKNDAQSKNQLVRWIITKEAHASKIIKVISEYFLTQKIAPVKEGHKNYAAYLTKLARHHAVMRAAMKTKQKASLKAAEALHKAIDGISGYWPAKK